MLAALRRAQIFDTSRRLGSQGWSFNMQASMLEIYNEEYRDLLTKARKDEKKHQVCMCSEGGGKGGVASASDLPLFLSQMGG